MVKTLFYTLLREICVWKPLPKVKISISKAHFFAAQTMTDFFNRIERKLPIETPSDVFVTLWCSRWSWSEGWCRRGGVAEMAEKMRKRSRKGGVKITNPRNDKALNNQGFVL